MPYMCCVPNCKGNYKTGPKVQVFSFPKDDELRKKWLNSIKRQDFIPSKTSKVCERHFKPEDIRKTTSAFDEKLGKAISYTLKVPQLVPGAVPSLLPNCPSYLSSATTSRPSRDEKNKIGEEKQMAFAIAQSMKEHELELEKSRVDSVATLKSKIILPAPWHVADEDGALMIFSMSKLSNNIAPVIDPVIVINDKMELNVFLKSVKLKKIAEHELPASVNSIQTVYCILDVVQTALHHNASLTSKPKTNDSFSVVIMLVLSLLEPYTDKAENYGNAIWFICEQLMLILNKQTSYSAQFSIFASLFYNVAPHAYRFLRDSGNCLLPSYSTVRRVTLLCPLSPSGEQNNEGFLMYIKSKFQTLLQSDKTVALLVDEIHIKPYFDYKGGNVVGAAYNSNDAATSAFAFMVNSVFSKYKEVVHVLPARKMNAEALFGLLHKTIIGLEKIGFAIIAVITDNNAINRKAMSLFAKPANLTIVYKHPVDETRPLFFILDAVHILKCIRNNWINQKTADTSMIFSPFSFNELECKNFPSFASFDALRLLHASECDSLMKFAYKLSEKALHPSNLERQNVNLVLQVFNNFVAQALLLQGEKCKIPHFADTSTFIRIINTWWSIVNVKTPLKGKRLANVFEEPLRKDDHISKQFLNYFLEWLCTWNSLPTKGGKLTRETFTALQHSTHALLEVAEYCLHELGATYVLLGKFQTDCLEARFGQYRQLSGAKYDVSMRQVYEVEKKIRMMSVLKLSLNNKQFTLREFKDDWNDFGASESAVAWPCEISEASQKKAEEYLPVITYVAGYCAYSVCKKLHCSSCKSVLACADKSAECLNQTLIAGLNRGGLLYPSDDIVSIVYFSYLVVDHLSSSSSFQHSLYQRNIALETIMTLLVFQELDILQLGSCSNSHQYYDVAKMIVWVSVNCLLNNYCSVKNDIVTKTKTSKKRKLATLVN